MNWRNFFVITGFGLFATAILYLIGEKELAYIMMVGYILYATITCVKDARKVKSVYSQFAMISDDNLVEILVCHFTKRHPLLKKQVEKSIIEDITTGNYTISSARISAMPKIPSEDPEDGYKYYLTFDNGKQYHVKSIVYDKAKIGDALWTVETRNNTIQVIKSGEEYFNMFTY